MEQLFEAKIRKGSARINQHNFKCSKAKCFENWKTAKSWKVIKNCISINFLKCKWRTTPRASFSICLSVLILKQSLSIRAQASSSKKWPIRVKHGKKIHSAFLWLCSLTSNWYLKNYSQLLIKLVRFRKHALASEEDEEFKMVVWLFTPGWPFGK